MPPHERHVLRLLLVSISCISPNGTPNARRRWPRARTPPSWHSTATRRQWTRQVEARTSGSRACVGAGPSCADGRAPPQAQALKVPPCLVRSRGAQHALITRSRSISPHAGRPIGAIDPQRLDFGPIFDQRDFFRISAVGSGMHSRGNGVCPIAPLGRHIEKSDP